MSTANIFDGFAVDDFWVDDIKIGNPELFIYETNCCSISLQTLFKVVNMGQKKCQRCKEVVVH